MLELAQKGILNDICRSPSHPRPLGKFAAFMAAEADEIGKDALEVELPYDQKAVLQESQVYIAKALITNMTMDVLIYNLDEANIPGPDTKKDKAEPSKPTLFLE